MDGQMMAALNVMPASPGLAAPQPEIFDPEVLRSICGDNAEVINRLLGRFIQVLDSDVRDLEGAVCRRSVVDVRHQAHRILGSALSVGAHELAAVIEHIGVVARRKEWDVVTDEVQSLNAAVSRLRVLLPQR